jgi:hypothetical protein
MATAAAIPQLPTSFTYADLISKSQAIQCQVAEFQNVFNDRCKNQTKLPDELKSRTLVFVDPYGNRIANKYMDHELIHKVIKKYKKDYVPKYLHQWIEIGTMNGDIISTLKDSELKSIVSHYENGYQFITYGEINVRLLIAGNFLSRKLHLKTLLSNDMNNILAQIRKNFKFDHAELKYCTTHQNAKPDQELWDQGTKLNLNDTILSCKLYQDNCVIVAKLMRGQASYNVFFLYRFDRILLFFLEFCWKLQSDHENIR